MQFTTFIKRMAANFMDVNNMQHFINSAMKTACSIIIIEHYKAVSVVQGYLKAVWFTRRRKKERLHTHTIIMFDKELDENMSGSFFI